MRKTAPPRPETEPTAPQPGDASTNHQVQRLLALNRAAVAITSELELGQVLQLIVDSARELAGCRYAALGVLGPDGYIARFPTSGISETEREQLGTPPRGHGLLGVMLRAGRTLRIPNINTDPRRVGFPPHHPPMTSLLGVPIWVRDRLMGDLYLTDKIDDSEFSEEDEWLVQLLATHAATALTNAELHTENLQALQRVRRERARFQALFRVTEAINRSVEASEVIKLVVESACELLDAAGAAVYLIQPAPPEDQDSSGKFHFSARYAVGLEDLAPDAPYYLPLEGSTAGRAYRARHAQVVNDILLEPDLRFPVLAGKTLRAVVAVPLIVGDEILGVLSAYADYPQAFDNEAVLLLEAFGAVASTAIHNVRLYEDARRGREAAEREQQRLRELESMKDEFLSTAAHELRTPLTSIRISAGLVQEQMHQATAQDAPLLDPRMVNLMDLVVEGSERMHALVNDLLDLTRLEHGRTALAVEDVDLREVVQTAVQTTRPLFDNRNQTLVSHLSETYCVVRGDRQRLEQVVINLLSNASKYAPPQTPVEIRVRRVGDECQVSVRDNGLGVPTDERERIFERFYRGSNHRRDRTASTGLGLPIARQITEMHHGRIWVEPAPGGGSIFILALPLVRS